MNIYNFLASGDWRQRQQAIETLSQLPEDDLAKVLIHIVRENHENLGALNASLQVMAMMGRAPFQEIISLLSSSDDDVRIYVPQLLGLLGDEQAVPALINALGDANSNVRFNAVEALGMLKAREAVAPLVDLLGGSDLFVAYAAVLALGEIGAAHAGSAGASSAGASSVGAGSVGEKILAELLPLVSHAYLGEAVISALGRLGNPSAVPSILRWLENPAGDPSVGIASLAQILRQNPTVPLVMPGEQAVGGSLRDAQDRLNRAVEAALDSPEEKQSAANQVGEKPIDSFLADAGLVLSWLHRSNPNDAHRRRLLVRLLAVPAARQAAESALRASPLPAPPELLSALSDPDIEVACAAADVLASLRDPWALYPLIEALESEDRNLSAHAALALGEMGLPEAVDVLVERLHSPEVYIRQSVISALARHPSPELTDRLSGLLESTIPHLREAAVRLLAETHDGRAEGAVTAALADPDKAVRKAAIEVLPSIKTPQAAAMLEQVLADPDASLRASAARTLASLPAQQAIPLLGRASQDADGWVRMYACRSLGELTQQDGLPWLLTCLGDRLPPVRLAALEAVARLVPLTPESPAREYIQPLLNDPSAEVRTAAQRYYEK